MKLKELLQQLQEVQQKIGASEVFSCGGFPRDRYMHQLDNVSDLDVTTGDKTIQYLAQEFNAELAKKYNVAYRTHNDGHSSINIGGFKIDFSSNFNVPNIEKLLQEQAIQKPTDMQKEMFSRDFTCNALLLSADLKNVSDPTQRGFHDIDEKYIRTCLSPNITLTTNKNRVIRAIYLACKLDFNIDQSIIQFVAKNPETVKIATDKVLREKLNQAFEKDADKAVHYLSQMNLWSLVPITDIMQPYYMKSVKRAYFQGGGGVNEPTPKKTKYKAEKRIVDQPRFKEPLYTNYDLYDVPGEHGPGAGWHDMHKYKSISEFLKAKRKKLKDKYKADDSYVNSDGKITKGYQLLNQRIKLAIDFPADQYIDPSVTIGTGSIMEILNPAGVKDQFLPYNDFEDKPVSNLDYGRNEVERPEGKLNLKEIEKLLNIYLKNNFYGDSDGVNISEEELDYPNNINPYYGTQGPNSEIYKDVY